jgi:hypothetical protein
MNKDKKAFVDSIIENKDILTFTLRDMYESLKSMRSDFYEVVTTDEVLLHMIYDSNIPVPHKRLMFMQLKTFTENERVKAAIDNYIVRSDTALDYIYGSGSGDLVYNLHRGNKGSLQDLHDIRSNFGGTFNSLNGAIGYIKHFNAKCIEDDPVNEEFIKLQFHLVDAIPLIRGEEYKSENFEFSSCAILLDSYGEILQIYVGDCNSDDKSKFPDLHPLFKQECDATHNFNMGDIVRPRWDNHNINIMDNKCVYFVKDIKGSKIFLTSYDPKHKVIYNIDGPVSAFSLDMESAHDYEFDANLYDFLVKYQSFIKGTGDYTIIDVLNSFSDCNVKGVD